MLLATGQGQRIRRALLPRTFVDDEIFELDGADGAGGAEAGEVGADLFDGAGEEGLDHGDVADDDGDEGFADGPAAGLLGAVRAGLMRERNPLSAYRPDLSGYSGTGGKR